MRIPTYVPPFLAVLEFPVPWSEKLLDVLMQHYPKEHLERRTGTLWRNRGMPTFGDQCFQEQNGPAHALVDGQPTFVGHWHVLLPGDPGVGHGPFPLDRLRLGVEDGHMAVVLEVKDLHSNNVPPSSIEHALPLLTAWAEAGATKGRADITMRFLHPGPDWFWSWKDGARRGRADVLPLQLGGMAAAFDPTSWLTPGNYWRGGYADPVHVMAGADAQHMTPSPVEAWLADQPAGSVPFWEWPSAFAKAYNQAPCVEGTACRVTAGYRDMIIGESLLTDDGRFSAAPVQAVEAPAAIEAMQRRFNAAGLDAQAALHVVWEVDDGA